MLNIKKCKFCSKLFEYRGFEYCNECAVKIDDTFVIVRDYVFDNPTASTAEILENTGVDEKMVNYLIKSGRLKAVARNAAVPCERCGKPTNSGRLCPECSEQIGQRLDKVDDGRKKQQNEEKKKAEAAEKLRGVYYSKKD